MQNIMNIAVKEAVKAKDRDDVPVGAVITCDGEVIVWYLCSKFQTLRFYACPQGGDDKKCSY